MNCPEAPAVERGVGHCGMNAASAVMTWKADDVVVAANGAVVAAKGVTVVGWKVPLPLAVEGAGGGWMGAGIAGTMAMISASL